MSATSGTEVVADASVVLKWFHAEGEEEVEAARRLLDAQRDRTMLVRILDLTAYEIGNALFRGRPRLAAERVAEVLDALPAICPAIASEPADLAHAARLAEEHGLTLYDAAYAAVARRRGAELVTLDGQLLRAGLGRRPSELAGTSSA
jgi:predicted nucleic acid-binding protein